MAGNKMAMLTEQKLKEMEAEMNRFEEEILTREGKLVPGQPRMIIGSNTYNKVQAKISKHGDHYHGDPHDDDGSGQEYDEDSSDVPNIPISVLSAPPPPPPSLLVGNKPRSTTPSLAPPPPPPPTLSFVPPQLRGQRPPPPPMPRPPMQGPPRPHPGYMGPGPGPFHGPSFHPGPPPPPSGMPPHMMPPGGPGSGPTGHVPPPFMSPNIGPQNMGGYGVSAGTTLGSTDSESAKTQDTIISKPKVVYSAAPVRLVPKGGHSKEKPMAEKTDKDKTGSNVTTDAGDKSQVMVGGTSGVLVGPAVMPPEREEVQGQGQESTEADDAGVGGKRAKKEKKKKYVRTAAGETWEDQSLEEWEPDDFRIFCGDLGNEVTDEVLARAFSKYTTFTKAKVIRDKRTNKTKGYGFVSFRDPTDFVRAMREMNGKYVGNRPIKLRKSTWKDRNIEIVRKKEKEKKRLGLR